MGHGSANPEPWICTTVPPVTGPDTGEIEVMTGSAIAVDVKNSTRASIFATRIGELLRRPSSRLRGDGGDVLRDVVRDGDERPDRRARDMDTTLSPRYVDQDGH